MAAISAIDLAFRLIAVLEGVELEAYWDPHGEVWTIGLGHTKGVVKGMKITMEQAIAFFHEDTAELLPYIYDRPMFEKAALICFGINLGKGALHNLLDGSIQITETGFQKDGVPYGRKSGGVIMDGLVRRRSLEAGLILASRQMLLDMEMGKHG